jgi:hypothetical protein
VSAHDGGPAFPSQTDTFRTPDGRSVWRPAESGMTLRDYFAAQALPALIAAFVDDARRGVKSESPAVVAYQMADAMLRAREAKP